MWVRFALMRPIRHERAEKGRVCVRAEGFRLAVKSDPKSPMAEAIRTLRTNLQYVALDRPLRTLMVTSAGPGEGKTTVSSNLAYSLAESGKRTILVGADLRKPTAHKVFGVSNAVGLTHVLLGHASLDEALVPIEGGGLQLLPSGPVPPNPAELIGSKAMRSLVEELKDRADIIIFDATPVVAVTDASLLAPMVDGTLVVVSVGHVPRETVRDAVAQLRKVNANILGVVANRVVCKQTESYYYYYYGESDGAGAFPGASNGKYRPAGIFGRRRGR